ncbi:transposase [Streptomyces goshikiensis]|uniref:transposase n=1 Tax=Streptomyces goshikiensis TaxID=1942 RepID=UPI002ADFC333|nr:transposase [Streptomyces goshikiensis]
MEQRSAVLFVEGLEGARLHVERFGHLAAVTSSGVGRWLSNRRVDAASLTVEQREQLRELDVWWNPPWPISWQRAWYRARGHVLEHGAVQGGDNLDGLPRWLERWLRRQISDYGQLHRGQQRLLAELGLSRGEVERFTTWPERRRPAAAGLAHARAYVARHGHLAVSRPVAVDGFALGTWLTQARRRQRSAGRPTRLGLQLTALDAWWNPSWPIAWQRMWWTCRYHLDGLPDGLEWWPGSAGAEHTAAWLHTQSARWAQLRPGQQELVDELLSLADGVALWQLRISDAAWQAMVPLLPARSHTGGRPRCERQLLEGILHVACTEQAWSSLPAELGSFQACRKRLIRWYQDGTLERICHTPLPEQDTHWQQCLTSYTHALGRRSRQTQGSRARTERADGGEGREAGGGGRW